jgi:alpha-1,3-rhamnosyl/mannosyltransferase
VLTGPSGWNEDIRGALAHLGDRVRSLGFVDRRDLDALVAGAAVFAYPSIEEGFGLPVLEAMALGAPVVTSLGTATAEVGGDAAVLVEPMDAPAITTAIDGLLADPDERERRRAAGLARAATYSWTRAAASYVELYRDAAA